MRIRWFLTLGYRLNLVGLLAGFLLSYVALSDRAWWVLVGGSLEQPAFLAQLSPFRVTLTALGEPVIIPIILYLVLGTRLSILVVAGMMIAGSLTVAKSWSKHLFSLDGFWTPLGFLIFLFIGSEFLKLKFGLSIPLAGRSLVDYALPYREEKILTHIPVAAEITWDYWMALAAGLLSLAAKFLHPTGQRA